MTVPPLPQLMAASALIVTLERIASSGVLSEQDEMDARRLIIRACRAFQIDTIAERPLPANDARADYLGAPV